VGKNPTFLSPANGENMKTYKSAMARAKGKAAYSIMYFQTVFMTFFSQQA
jgi:hypothetical protein